MTDTDVDLETLVQRIADRGHDALVERLRTAYSDAAAAHADLISLDDEQIESMVQSAAEHADGLQWRRALAGVAAEELGVSVTEALTHPAVARAQALVGAPSYEQSLAELIARPVPADVLPEPEPPTPEPEPDPEPEPPMPDPPAPAAQSVSAADSELPATAEHQSMAAAEPGALEVDELETVEADDVVLELLPEPDPIEYETQAYDIEASFTEEEEPPTLEPEPFSAAAPTPAEPAEQPTAIAEPPTAIAAPPTAIAAPGASQAEPDQAMADAAVAEPDQAMEFPASTELHEGVGFHEEEPDLVFVAIHQGGVANLPTRREGLSVRLSADGLDILQGEGEIIGRLVWDEIEALEVPNLRTRRRRSEPRARLLVRTPHGDASFDVPGILPDELRDRVEPLVRLYGRH
jgi:hypothetical protein